MRIMKNTYKIILTFTLTLLFQFGVNAQTLDSLFQLAIENNSELKAVNSEFQSILLKQDQVSQLPNPQIGVGVPILRPETRLGPQVMMVSATQMFPWFGTFDAKKEVVLQMSKAKYEELSAIKLDLFYQIKVAYFKIQFLSQKEHLYEEAISNYETIESIALAKVESGQATLADVLRIQTKVEEYTNLMKQIENEKTGLYSQINNITNQPLEQEVIIKDSLDSDLISYDLESYRIKIENHHPLLNKLNYQIAASESRIIEDQKNNLPTIGIGVDYSLVNQRTDADPLNNGRDILVPKVMVSIPIYRKSYTSSVKEEQLYQESINFRKENLTDQMISNIISYKAEYDNAKLNFDLTKSQIEKISSAYEILLGSYSADGKKIEELLSTQNELINLKLKSDFSELNMAISKAKIERLTNY